MTAMSQKYCWLWLTAAVKISLILTAVTAVYASCFILDNWHNCLQFHKNLNKEGFDTHE